MARGDLLEFAGAVAEALRWLDSAEIEAGNLLTDPQTGEEYPWKTLLEAANRLAAAREALQKVLEPIKDELEEARKQQDEDEDRWDATRL